MPSRTVPKEVLARFQRLFKGRETMFGHWKQDDVKTVSRPLTEVEWQQHLQGKGPYLGIIPITETNDCYFGAIDVDGGSAEVPHASLAAMVEHAELPLVVCRSKSGGAHLFLFLKDPAPAKLVKDKLKNWADALKLRSYNKRGEEQPIEVFPKQTKLSPTVQGNWINLPYYGNGTTDRYAVLSDGQKLGIEQFLDLAEQVQISSTMLEGLSPKLDQAFEKGPPCLNILHGLGYPEGSRNMGLFNVGVYLKLSDEDSWRERLSDYNRDKMDPPLKERDVRAVIMSLERRDYMYRCEDMPISPHCDKPTCKKQEFGIGAFRKKVINQNMPDLSNLRKLTTDPPRWLLNVDGTEVELQTEELMLVPRFRRAVLERCSRIFPLLKQYEWDDKLMELLKDHTVIEAPEDAGELGQFRFLLSEFLMRRVNARTREDLLMGLPVQEGAKVFFRSPDLLAFLERKKFRAYDAPDVFTALRALGAGHNRINIKGATIQVWFVDTPQDEQKEDFEALQDEDPAF